MKSIAQKIYFLSLPLIIFILLVFTTAYSSDVLGQDLQTGSYPPPVNKVTQDGNKNNTINSEYSFYLPYTRKDWEYPDILTPFHSYSLYFKTIDEQELFNAGCAQGTSDWEEAGVQNSIVFLNFGRPNDFGYGLYGTLLHDFITYATTNQIAIAVFEFASGYYLCTGIDTNSKITIAIGTNNDSDYDVTYEHGLAWAQMVVEADSLLTDSIRNQVSLVAASNMELEFDDPTSTRAWVDGYNDNSQYPFRLY